MKPETEKPKPKVIDALLRPEANAEAAIPVSAKEQIREMAKVLRRGADSLDQLVEMLPKNPSTEEERSLNEFIKFSIKTGLIQKFI